MDVEITDFPGPGRPAKGRVIEVLGPPDAFGVDVEIIIRKHHLPHVFPANVLAEATASAEQTVDTLDAEEIAQRRDFRGAAIVTIDGETARDFDDAVMVRELPNGNWELQVHIADVSWYVRPGTALDLEARLRGTSVYFPDRAIPMLPQQAFEWDVFAASGGRPAGAELRDGDRCAWRGGGIRGLRGDHSQRGAADVHAGAGTAG